MDFQFTCLFLFGILGLTALSIYDFSKGRYSAKAIVISEGTRKTRIFSWLLMGGMIIAIEFIDNQILIMGLYGIMIADTMIVLTIYQIIYYMRTKEEVFLWRIGSLDVCAILLFLLVIKELPKMIR